LDRRQNGDSLSQSRRQSPIAGWLPYLHLAFFAAAMVFFAGPSIAVITVAACLAGAGAGPPAWPVARERATSRLQLESVETQAAARLEDRDAYTRELERLNVEVLPIMARHVQASRQVAEENIGSLSQRFSAMVDELGRVINASESTRIQAEFEGFMAGSRQTLEEVVASLESLLQRESAMVRQIEQLFSSVGSLASMATSVRSVADQINVLALNAAIEAARAGENGRGFAVVADEVRKLAATSAHAGEQISGRISEISAAMSGAVDVVTATSASDDEAVKGSREGIRTVLDGMQQLVARLGDDAGSLRQSSEDLHAEINQSLVALQFQDRLDQTLQHVQASLEEMEATLVGVRTHSGPDRHQDMLSVDQLLQRMLDDYTTHEEKQRHRSGGAAVANATASDLTFF
jgi:methyl-accepting chemotaxis protein